MPGTNPAAVFDPASRSDPYALYGELRDRDEGVHFVESFNAWIVMRTPTWRC